LPQLQTEEGSDMEDGRGRLGLGGRRELVRLVAEGASLRAAARRLGVAPATAHRWWHRSQAAWPAERRSGACLRSRPPRPRSCPWRLTPAEESRILEARRRTNLGPARLAGLVGRRRSTIWKVLRRHGISRRRRTPAPARPARRYEWAEPGALLHVDTKQLARFDRPGHFAHGDRAEEHRTRGAGYLFAHCVVDDRTRLAYVELHPDQRGQTCAAVLVRAARWFCEQGCGPARAVMHDNALSYVRSREFVQALASLGARAIVIPPRTPRWNGEVERFIRTLDEEWAHGRLWASSAQRARALLSFLRYYNRRRPHSALGDRPPISRVQQERGQYT
jgi:transposase InsO family protein